MNSLLTPLVFLLMIILTVVWLWESSTFKNTFLDLYAFWNQFTRITKLVIFVCVAGFVIYGGSKSTNNSSQAQSSYVLDTSAAGLSLSSVPLSMTAGAAVDLELLRESAMISTQSCMAGFALIKAVTNSSSWFSDRQNEVVYDRWQRYGVSEDSFYLSLTNSGFSFPLGSNIYSAVHIASLGLLSFDGPQSMAGAALDPLGSEAFLAPMNGIAGIVPADGSTLSYYTSRTNCVVTWSNVYANRTNLYPISYQAELRDSGDFIYRYAFSSNFVNSSAATNFHIAAFNHSYGERYSFNLTNTAAEVRELRWKAFLPVEPGVWDHDSDGVSSVDELYVYGTDISRSDTDCDGVSDYDEIMNPSVYNPLNPDSDGDSLVDSMDPQPGTYNDPSAVDPVDGYTLAFKIANLGPAGAVMNFLTDSDGDGFEDWKELLAGTLIGDYSSRPVADDNVTTLFSATITLASTLPEPVLLTIGERKLMLREAGSITLWLNEGVANTLSLRAVHGCDVPGLSITIGSSYASYAGDTEPFDGTVHLRSGEQTKYGMVVQPSVSTAENWICFHDEPTRSAHATVLPENCPGYPQWDEYGSNFTITDSYSLSAILQWYGTPGCDYLYFEYYLPGAADQRAAYVHVTKCAVHGSSTSSESSSVPVAVNNDDDDGNETDDLSDSTVESENDLYESRPIYGHGESCCPHYGYGPNPEIIATRTYCSGRVRTYSSPSKTAEKTEAFPGDPVFVEGQEASTAVGAEKIIWSWTEEGEAKASTNYYTVFSLRLFGDLDFDNDVDATDRAAVTNLTEQHGWNMPVASNILRKVELKTDVRIPGRLILSLSGTATVRVWNVESPTTNDTPLLITGQTVTNGIDGASFGAYPESMIYVEAIDAGTATLTYSYVGTDSAEGFGYQAQLAMTSVKVEFVEDENQAYGFDYDGPWVSIETSKTTTVTANIYPPSAASLVYFVSSDTSKINVSPSHASTSSLTLTVIAGATDGDNVTIDGRLGSAAGIISARLGVAVYKKGSISCFVHKVNGFGAAIPIAQINSIIKQAVIRIDAFSEDSRTCDLSAGYAYDVDESEDEHIDLADTGLSIGWADVFLIPSPGKIRTPEGLKFGRHYYDSSLDLHWNIVSETADPFYRYFTHELFHYWQTVHEIEENNLMNPNVTGEKLNKRQWDLAH